MKIEKIHNFYKNKKILIIGHTGFKGSWLSVSLKAMGSKIYGISLVRGEVCFFFSGECLIFGDAVSSCTGTSTHIMHFPEHFSFSV